MIRRNELPFFFYKVWPGETSHTVRRQACFRLSQMILPGVIIPEAQSLVSLPFELLPGLCPCFV